MFILILGLIRTPISCFVVVLSLSRRCIEEVMVLVVVVMVMVVVVMVVVMVVAGSGVTARIAYF